MANLSTVTLRSALCASRQCGICGQRLLSGRVIAAAAPTRTTAAPSRATSLSRPHLPLTSRTFVSATQPRLERVKGGQPDEGERKIIDILTKRFAPKKIQVADISGGCGSFYAITLVSKEFNGLTTIKQHRLVNSELKDVIAGIHGLQLRTRGEE
ncbi:hypothetical protein V8E36_007991 [Tilletia maclaganii]